MRLLQVKKTGYRASILRTKSPGLRASDMTSHNYATVMPSPIVGAVTVRPSQPCIRWATFRLPMAETGRPLNNMTCTCTSVWKFPLSNLGSFQYQWGTVGWPKHFSKFQEPHPYPTVGLKLEIIKICDCAQNSRKEPLNDIFYFIMKSALHWTYKKIKLI